MKRLSLLLTVALLLTLCLTSCKPLPEKASARTTTVTEKTSVEPMEAKVELIGDNGTSLPYWSMLKWSFDGQISADGELMFLSVPEVLKGCTDRIPAVELGRSPEIRATAREGVEIDNAGLVDVYSEELTLLAERVPLSELDARGKAEWPGKTVYLYFTVTFQLKENGKQVRGSSNGYFVKTTFTP